MENIALVCDLSGQRSKVGGECTSCRDTITLNFSFMKETEASLLTYRDASRKTLVISIFLYNYYKTLLIFYSWFSHSKTIIRYTYWVLIGSFCFYMYFFAIWKMSIYIMSIPNCLWSFNGILIDFYNVCFMETFWIFESSDVMLIWCYFITRCS